MKVICSRLMGSLNIFYFDNTGNLDCVPSVEKAKVLFTHLGHMRPVSQHPSIVSRSVNQ